MRLSFTKMQGAGNDFVVLDALRAPIELTPAQARRLADRRYGVGADAETAVGQAARQRGRQFQRRTQRFEYDEVVARALHLGEAQSLSLIHISEPTRPY